jgi:hypothetical protein
MLLVVASAAIHGFESRRTHHHIFMSQIRDSTNLEDQAPCVYAPGTGWPSYTPGTGFPFHRLLQFAGLQWRYSNDLHIHDSLAIAFVSRYISCFKTSFTMLFEMLLCGEYKHFVNTLYTVTVVDIFTSGSHIEP